MYFLRVILLALCATTSVLTASAKNDTVFIYSPGPNDGLHIAVREIMGDASKRHNNAEWRDLGRLCSSDYGTWGAEKRMYAPSLCRANDGTWRLVFQVNDHAPIFAASYSRDLVNWRPQDYPRVTTRQCLKPVVNLTNDGFEVSFESEQGPRVLTASYDFRHFTSDVPWRGEKRSSDSYSSEVRHHLFIDGKGYDGQLFAITAKELAAIRQHFEESARDWRLSSERMHDDGENEIMQKLKNATIEATLTLDPTKEKIISDKLIGIFFEDISYAADGGLYGELIQNRDFEYSPRDHARWEPTTAWHKPHNIVISTDDPLTPENPHHALVINDSLWNEGWDGIPVKAREKYDFSMFVRGTKTFIVQLIALDGSVIASAQLKADGKGKNKAVGALGGVLHYPYGWRKYECTLTAKKTEDNARLLLLPQGNMPAAIDMVSLFPRRTFKNRKNGLRRDLANVIANLHPKFVRFPGGCMSHGQGLDNIYHWNHTIGPLESRKPDFNIWHYHQTRGLGFYEYFQFCEDIGAEPLPVLAAGVPCQNSAANAEGIGGQQGGIPMADMPAYIDELCNLIDWANGNPATNKWARMRADAGHPKPFNLKYIGIGNEDIISTVFEERYEMICSAIRERHPEIKICGTVGPFHAPSADYLEGWDLCRRNPDLQYMTDEHYYESTGWFINHRDYYDKYPRGKDATKVYLGEWAASTNAKRPNVETALAEALYLTDIERNGDIVEMTSYAPMLCKDGHSNWNPDMIYFTNTTIRTTPAYEIQRLFSVYSGDRWVNSELRMTNDGAAPEGNSEFGIQNPDLSRRLGASLVRDSKTGKRYLKLVNALPSTVKIKVEGITLPAKVKCRQFTGALDDQKAQTKVIETKDPTTLPPYSLRVIEL